MNTITRERSESTRVPTLPPPRAWSGEKHDTPRIVATATGLPRHRYDQDALAELAASYLPAGTVRDGTIERFFRRTGVRERYLSLPVERYRALRGLGERNDAWIETATALGETVVRALLDEAGLDASEVDLLATTTVTGIAVPSLEARLMNRLPFHPSTKRMPLFGLGCLGGAAGLARVADYLRGAPTEAAILLSVELCSLTFQPHDGSLANIVSTGLFGDGAAAVLLVGAAHPLAAQAHGPHVIDSRSAFFPNSERVMGWDVVDSGFRVVLSSEVAAVVSEHIPRVVDELLGERGLDRDDIDAWIVHPGGPKVIDALTAALALAPDALDPTRDCLERVGNLSSSSVLFLLDERRRRPPRVDGLGLLMAMGPAFCAELVLLSW
jgi:alkylresorcinol/alkylpyrone synthase